MLFVEFPSKMGYIHDVLFPNKQRVWLWNVNVSEPWQDTLNIGSSAKTIKDFRPFKSKNALRKAYQKDVGNSDLKIPDAYWSFINEVRVGDIVVGFEPKKGNGKQYHMLHGWGIITSDCTLEEENDNPMCRTVQWHSILEIPKQNEEMSNSLFFQGTTDKQALHIKELLNINTETGMNSKYQKYIDLLKANKNLILTGAPGTGKTFMAKEIAKAMGCEDEEIGFVQFHPSYDYTDFVEGLRPIKDDNGNVGFERKDGVFKAFCIKAKNIEDSNKSQQNLTEKRPHNVFIIDEINRGEISKIFGELFFSIDPGYRGEAGKVQTQYQNMVEDGDVFKDGFYVPENVYIIGTMNDIDRSVESMDFAMRRRFAWAEVTAEESMQMLDGMPNEEALKNRMRNLNETILKTNGLGKAYQIGAAYFKKYEQYNSFELLWKYHLDGLLTEYLRGSANAEKELAELKKAYEDESPKNVEADNHKGQ
ncbi:MAG: AAA family ATPase [Prevotella sp.]|nr:AAA family ATPase [Prevotella sp.]